jgi:hypothetical protein
MHLSLGFVPIGSLWYGKYIFQAMLGSTEQQTPGYS